MVKLELKAEPGDPYGTSHLKSCVYDALQFGSQASSLKECDKYKSNFVTPKTVAKQLAQIGFLFHRCSSKTPKEHTILFQILQSTIDDFPEAAFILSAYLYSICCRLKVDEQPFIEQFKDLATDKNSPLIRYSAGSVLLDYKLQKESENVFASLKKKIPGWTEPRLKLAECFIAQSEAETSQQKQLLLRLQAINEILDCARETESRGRQTYKSCMEAALLSLACPGDITAECAMEAARHINQHPPNKPLLFSLFPREALILWTYGQFCGGHQDNCIQGLEHLKNSTILNDERFAKIEKMIFEKDSNEKSIAFYQQYQKYKPLK